MKRPVTIKDIAKMLGISKSTVSRAIRGSEEINPETKKRIMDLVEELDYQPNAFARSLLKHRSNTIGVVIPAIENSFFANLISGVQHVAHSKGYNVMICQTNDSFDREVSDIRTLCRHQVDGIILSLSSETKSFDHLQSVIDKDIAFVMADRTTHKIEAPRILVNDRDGAYNATKHLIENGYRNIIHLAGPESLEIANLRAQGFSDAMEEAGSTDIDSKIFRCPFREEKARELTLELLKDGVKFDAVFAASDKIAVGAMMAIKEAGLYIPDDVALVGFTDLPMAKLLTPSLTTIQQPAQEMGRKAAELLLESIEDKESHDSSDYVMTTRLIQRESTKSKVGKA
ncbi:LacI family transcriptional regulator (plasmid) [Fulvitalea axinellae]|uniref:LacI family transcriptional regulator n=1 Tax=Fulvitalea axinellae TaxID=1182444 RepID=A0AAU9DLS5_9BACT|nr:LacI family transcriptional regulator [Fulvitalea axinellae]